MNALVAEKVIGLGKWVGHQLENEHGSILAFRHEGQIKTLPPGYGSYAALPYYSSDISAAWEVVEKLGSGNFAGLDYRSGGWLARIYRGDSPGWYPTAPLAICHAALQVVLRHPDLARQIHDRFAERGSRK